ncbi:hypothetical protein [Sulfuricurvum sp.]|uniref:hypothetical protein n=1 Tax=Sulfuricurvum sp. TaxID=2025608 RepID=UPI003BAF48CC
MIKLLGLLFSFIALYGGEIPFHTPNQHHDFIYRLNTTFKSASRILIVTPSLNHPELQKGILNAAKHGSRITLIVQDLKGAPLSMVQYAGVDLYTSAASLDSSAIIIDEHFVCTLNGKINQEDFALKRSYIRCNDNPGAIEAVRHSLESVLSSSKPYLE